MRLLRLGLIALAMLGACGNAKNDNGDSGDATPTEKFRVRFETTKGDFVIEVVPEWAPRGAQRFRKLVEVGFFDDSAFFRVMPRFVVQFGISGDRNLCNTWMDNNIQDDPVKVSNRPGYVSFATMGKNTRSTQLFINLGNNQNLDGMGFAPIGRVVDGMRVVNQINPRYGERPQQHLIRQLGNDYLKKNFPNLDYIKRAVVE